MLNGYSKLNKVVFGRDLRAAHPSVGRGQRGPRDDRVWVYTGIGLTDAIQEHVIEQQDGHVTIDFAKVRRPK
jgi:hypothetical protein